MKYYITTQTGMSRRPRGEGPSKALLNNNGEVPPYISESLAFVTKNNAITCFIVLANSGMWAVM